MQMAYLRRNSSLIILEFVVDEFLKLANFLFRIVRREFSDYRDI